MTRRTARRSRTGPARRLVPVGLAALVALTAASPASAAPPEWGYELVSPDDASGSVSGVSSKGEPAYSVTTEDGKRLLYGATNTIAGAQRGFYKPLVFGERGATGWRAVPGLSTTTLDSPLDMEPSRPASLLPASDGSAVAFRINTPLGPPNTLPDGSKASIYRTGLDGSLLWASQAADGSAIGDVETPEPVGGSPDLSTVYFRYRQPLTAEAGDELRETDPTFAEGVGLYERRGAALHPAGVLPSGVVSPTGALPMGLARSSQTQITSNGFRNQVSRDGRRLFFVSTPPGGVRQLYVREAGVTRLVSRHADATPAVQDLAPVSEVPQSDDGMVETLSGQWSPYGFGYASPDGTRVFFRSTDNLTPDSSGPESKLYRADIGAVDITVSLVTDSAGDRVDGVPLGVNDDGSRVFFAVRSTGYNTPRLVVWDGAAGGALSEVGTTAGSMADSVLSVRSADSGRTWVFTARGDFDPDRPGASGTVQTYRWSIGDTAPDCLSCRTDGGATSRNGSHFSLWDGGATEFLSTARGVMQKPFLGYRGARGTSADGRRVYFDSPDPLVPCIDGTGDCNTARDVYRWDAEGGLTLVSGGRDGGSPAYYLDSDADGGTVFFASRDKLLPEDDDGNYDVYAQRLGGGFVRPPVVAPCQGEACQGPVGTLPPVGGAPASSTVGPPTVGAREVPRTPVARLRIRAVRKSGNAVRMRVSVPGRGRLTLSAPGTRTVKRATKKAASASVKLNLTARSAARLRRTGRLRLTIRARFVPSSGKATTTTVRFTLKRTTKRSA